MPTILITGGAGAIGSNLTNQLSQNPDNRIIVLDNLSSGRVENIRMRSNVRFIQGSVESDEDLTKVFEEQVETVFHLAANFANQNSVDFPQRDLQVNGHGTLKLLLKAVQHDVRKVVYTSSSCVYGNRDEPLDESCREFSLDTPYAITKLLGEQYVRFFHEQHKLQTVILRYFNVYGPNEYPGRYRNVIANFFYLAMRDMDITITGTGEETRDFNFVEDSVRATLLCAEKDAAVGQVINIASGMETSIRKLTELIISITDSKSRIFYRERRDWDSVVRRVASISVARDILGYIPQISLEEGLGRYYQWLMQQDLKKCEW